MSKCDLHISFGVVEDSKGIENNEGRRFMWTDMTHVWYEKVTFLISKGVAINDDIVDEIMFTVLELTNGILNFRSFAATASQTVLNSYFSSASKPQHLEPKTLLNASI